MPDGNQAGITGQQIQSVNGNDGDQDIVDYQHGSITELNKKRPDEHKNQKADKDHPVQVRKENALLLFVGGEKISGCQPPILRHNLHPLNFMYAEKTVRLD